MKQVHVGILTENVFTRSGPPCSIIGLDPDNIGRNVPVGENPAIDFQMLGWVCAFKQQW